MNQEVKNKVCSKCRSLNPAEVTHCRYCHHGLAQLKTFVDRSEIKKTKVKRNLLIAGAGVVATAAGYIWRKKSTEGKD